MNDIKKSRNESSILQLISDIYLREFRSDYDCLVSFVNCRFSPDGGEVKIGVSLYGDESETRKAWERIKKAGGYFAGRIGRKLRFKITPRFVFERLDADSLIPETGNPVELPTPAASDNSATE